MGVHSTPLVGIKTLLERTDLQRVVGGLLGLPILQAPKDGQYDMLCRHLLYPRHPTNLDCRKPFSNIGLRNFDEISCRVFLLSQPSTTVLTPQPRHRDSSSSCLLRTHGLPVVLHESQSKSLGTLDVTQTADLRRVVVGKMACPQLQKDAQAADISFLLDTQLTSTVARPSRAPEASGVGLRNFDKMSCRVFLFKQAWSRILTPQPRRPNSSHFRLANGNTCLANSSSGLIRLLSCKLKGRSASPALPAPPFILVTPSTSTVVRTFRAPEASGIGLRNFEKTSSKSPPLAVTDNCLDALATSPTSTSSTCSPPHASHLLDGCEQLGPLLRM